MFYLTRWKINRITKKIKAMQADRHNSQPSDVAVKKEIACYFSLAALYKKLIGCKRAPYAQVMMVACYRAAAILEDARAHFYLARLFIEEAKFRERLQTEGVFASPANQIQMQTLYEKAHAHLLAAIQLDDIDAKRLKGLCLINGWGQDIDKDAGFELIVASIEQEGSWDKVPQLFATLGLNKPEFFAAIMKRRKQ